MNPLLKTIPSRRRVCRIATQVVVLLIAAAFARAQTYKFASLPAAKYGFGINPTGALVQDAASNLYGSTSNGDDYHYFGTIFEITHSGKPIVLHSFSPYEGEVVNGLMIDQTGNIYGTSLGGGRYAVGDVFELDSAGVFTILYSFLGTDGGASDGESPNASLIQDDSGNLYGTTLYGGGGQACNGYGCGTVFKIDASGNETILHTFQDAPDGNQPQDSLIMDSAGNLYGTTIYGGAYGVGAIFKIDASGDETILYSFQGGLDGANPVSNLILDSDGTLYGTTSQDGGCGICGTVFKLDTSGDETVLHDFTGGSDGAIPYGGVVADPAGNLYGTTASGGPANDGVVFKLDTEGHETVLQSFDGTNGNSPRASLLRESNGTLYGNTYAGGSGACRGDYFGCGVIFSLKP